MAMTLSVVVPAYNEEQNIGMVLNAAMQSLPRVHEIIVVDDASGDRTAQIAGSFSQVHPQIRVIQLARHQGKTAALRAGFAASLGDIVVVQDADLEYDPNEIPDLIEPIVSGKADVVYGSRFLVRKATRVLYFRHYVANKALTFMSDLLTDLNLSDVETGYKAFRGEIVRNLIIRSSGFGFEIEVTAKVAKLGCRIYEVPISYYGRTYAEGKKVTIWDGLAAFYYVVRYNLFCGLRSSFVRVPDMGKK